MLKNRIIRLFGLIIAVTVKSALAKEITSCSVYEDLTFNDSCQGESPVKFCLNNGEGKDNRIYGINESSQCTPAINDGTYVFSVINNDSIIVSSSATIRDASSLILYQCFTDSEEVQMCLRTAGYVFINSNYYSIPFEEDKQSSEVIINELKTSCYDNDGSYHGSIINDNDTIKFCLNDDDYINFPKSEVEANSNYYIYGYESYRKYNYITGPFENINKSKKYMAGVVIQPIYKDDAEETPSMITLNRFFSETNVCFNSLKNNLMNRRINLCDPNADCTYIYCTNGLCKHSDSINPRINEGKCYPIDEDNYQYCDDGYYLLKSDKYYNYYLATEVDDVGDLYYCKNHVCSKKTTLYGIFKNADKTNENNAPFIRCGNFNDSSYVFNGCKVISVPNEDKTECTERFDLINVTVGEGDQQTTEVSVCLSEEGNMNVSPVTSVNPIFSVIYDQYSLYVYIADNYSFHTIDGYFLINKTNKQIIIEGNTKGTLYECKNNFCHEYSSIGYIYNTVYDYNLSLPFIQCKTNSSNEYELVDVTKTSCSALKNDGVASDGELFKTTETINDEEITSFNICIDTTVEPSISLKLEDEYFISKENKVKEIEVMVSTNNGNIFGNKKNKYVNIKVESKNIKFLKDVSYFYRLTNENYMVYHNINVKNQDFCADKTKIIEFELQCPSCEDYDPRVSYYSKIIEN